MIPTAPKYFVPRKLADIRSRLSNVTRRTVHFQRSPATHLFVFMVSSESCSKKPYVLPVQYIPNVGLRTTLVDQQFVQGNDVIGDECMGLYFIWLY